MLFLTKFLFKPRLFVHLMLLTTLALMGFLLASCTTKGLSSMNLVSSGSSSNSTSNSTVAVGYFGICVDKVCSTVKWSGTNSSTSAVAEFRDHSIRPYFVCLGMGVGLAAYIMVCMTSCMQRKVVIAPLALGGLGLWLFVMVIAAVWQEVAVHAALLFLGVERGASASGAVWSCVGLLTVAGIVLATERSSTDNSSEITKV